MDEVFYVDGSYCAICDQGFPNDEARALHIQSSTSHPCCEPCNRRFLNGNALRSHYVLSSRHHYCAACEKTFNSAAGLRMHIEYAAVHRDDSDDDDDSIVEEPPVGWEDEFGQHEFPNEESAEHDGDQSEGDDYFDFDEEEIPHGHSHSEALSTTIDRALALADLAEGVGGTSSSALDTETTPKVFPPAPLPHTCPICLSAPTSYSATRCGHIFCTPCIHYVFRTEEMCPLCREPGTVKQLRKLHSML